MLGLIKNEIYKILRLKKLFTVFLVIVGLETIAVFQYNLGTNQTDMHGQSLFFALMGYLPFIYTLFIAVFVSEQWTEEHATIKLSLTRPIKRITLLGAKTISYFMCMSIVILFSVISSCVIGFAAFGWGGKVLLGSSAVTSTFILGLYLKTTLSVLLPTLGFGLLVTFIAVLTNSTGITIGVSLGFAILSQFLELAESIKAYSIMHHMRTFYQIVLQKDGWETGWYSLLIIVAYIVVFFVLSGLVFNRKDITT